MNMPETDTALHLARQSLYRFTALALLDPRAGSWDALQALRQGDLVSQAAALVRSEAGAQATSLAMGEQPLESLDPCRLFKALPDTEPDFSKGYGQAFGLLVSNACPPYETEYINEKLSFRRSQTLGDVNGFYHAFGLAVSTQYPERPDHIVLELEFMALVVRLEQQAIEDSRGEQVEICRDAQARFLREHLAWWVPTFARLVARENPGGFYEHVGTFLAAWMAAERSYLGVPPDTTPVGPSRPDPPGQCEGCLAAAKQ
jgi:TorA maturation chaperone TorD